HFWGELADVERCLVIGFVDDAVCADEASAVEQAMCIAERWAGLFHRINENSDHPLHRYDLAYYQTWPRRTSELAAAWHDRFPWLADLCASAEGFMAALVDRPTTVIH